MLELITQALPFIFAVVFYAATISCFLDIAKWLDKRRNARLYKLRHYSPILLPMVRKFMPNLIAMDLVGVQPMTAPTGNVFKLLAQYNPVQLDMFQKEYDEMLRQQFIDAAEAYHANKPPHQFELFPEKHG